MFAIALSFVLFVAIFWCSFFENWLIKNVSSPQFEGGVKDGNWYLASERRSYFGPSIYSFELIADKPGVEFFDIVKGLGDFEYIGSFEVDLSDDTMPEYISDKYTPPPVEESPKEEGEAPKAKPKKKRSKK